MINVIVLSLIVTCLADDVSTTVGTTDVAGTDLTTSAPETTAPQTSPIPEATETLAATTSAPTLTSSAVASETNAPTTVSPTSSSQPPDSLGTTLSPETETATGTTQPPVVTTPALVQPLSSTSPSADTTQSASISIVPADSLRSGKLLATDTETTVTSQPEATTGQPEVTALPTTAPDTTLTPKSVVPTTETTVDSSSSPETGTTVGSVTTIITTPVISEKSTSMTSSQQPSTSGQDVPSTAQSMVTSTGATSAPDATPRADLTVNTTTTSPFSEVTTQYVDNSIEPETTKTSVNSSTISAVETSPPVSAPETSPNTSASETMPLPATTKLPSTEAATVIPTSQTTTEAGPVTESEAPKTSTAVSPETSSSTSEATRPSPVTSSAAPVTTEGSQSTETPVSSTLLTDHPPPSTTTAASSGTTIQPIATAAKFKHIEEIPKKFTKDLVHVVYSCRDFDVFSWVREKEVSFRRIVIHAMKESDNSTLCIDDMFYLKPTPVLNMERRKMTLVMVVFGFVDHTDKNGLALLPGDKVIHSLGSNATQKLGSLVGCEVLAVTGAIDKAWDLMEKDRQETRLARIELLFIIFVIAFVCCACILSSLILSYFRRKGNSLDLQAPGTSATPCLRSSHGNMAYDLNPATDILKDENCSHPYLHHHFTTPIVCPEEGWVVPYNQMAETNSNSSLTKSNNNFVNRHHTDVVDTKL